MEVDRSWLDLPVELLEAILSKLPLSDHPRFACVCKDWKKLTSRVYPADRSPILNRSFKVDFPAADLSKARLYSSKDGWLVLCREEEVLLVNPFTDTVRRFPGLVHTPSFTGIEFIGQPPDKCCIFAIESAYKDSVLIYFWNGEGWGRYRYENNIPFVMSPHSNPVDCGRYFLCLGKDGNIGAFDMLKGAWIVVELKNFPTITVGGSYLVGDRGNVRAITVGGQNSTVRVFELIPAEGWAEFTDLKARALFIGPRMALVSANSPKKLDDIVFFSRLLGTPEEIEAEIRCSEGRIYFVPKKSTTTTTGPKKTSEGGIYTYNLTTGGRSEYCGSFEYPCILLGF
ncbi:uncharacterized protein A4U43_C01F2140 [Asparagus officinalis]|uniref:F-box domain-containing protein n=1 Tax=Asparagus officinalis TaxID=4686 RepID=A0A5P1FPW3_ASPOF|nr:F-box/kelch-repeat protein At1g57790-like [Asparagus officinalis]XP_020271311.1 F-box/kelch-repeat protein At1g57790-like [Asparagus officinalis]XP_020271316.1 F-box/kelch-repeat protein At1g57790-like [Asparagus officinalis]XP_020271323.1 F-box/kelch-repeat protein At1g57790-like [Asparagus officinalis]XP_020271330.1 F-box/kelch-repeat protein At1g57790-like [Asparagus officinalis]XP_020271341.1 F-box/kelch-repeat protein At1g57790-like [Asparagus officinalis]ONK79029.1 uncharacterized pr